MTVRSGTIGGVQDQSTAVISMQAEELAARYGLRRVGTRSSLGGYVRVLWSRRHYITVLPTPKAYSRSQNNYLGQLWSVLNPLILAAVYQGRLRRDGPAADDCTAYRSATGR